MACTSLDRDELKNALAKGTLLVDFWAPWCGPCRDFEPTFERVADANPDITFARIDIDEHPELATEFGIQAIPTLLAFREGGVAYRQSGTLPAHALQRIVDEIRSMPSDEPHQIRHWQAA